MFETDFFNIQNSHLRTLCPYKSSDILQDIPLGEVQSSCSLQLVAAYIAYYVLKAWQNFRQDCLCQPFLVVQDEIHS